MYAVLPKNAKPSRTASKDQTRPILTRGELVQTGDAWHIVTTDSYALAVLPVEVRDLQNINTPALEAGPIPAEALSAIEKAGAFTANGAVCPVNEHGVAVAGAPSFERREDGTFPKHEQLLPDVPEARVLKVGLNPFLLLRLAQSLGCSETKRRSDAVILHLDVEADRDRGYGRGVRVTTSCGDGVGVVMPIRAN